MFQSIVVYSFTFFIVFFFAFLGKQKRKWYYLVIGIFLYAIIFGLRWDVGNDYIGYKYFFETINNFNSDSNHEIGFVTLALFIKLLYLQYPWFFGIIAFLQLYIFSYCIKSEKYLYPYFVFVFFIGTWWLSFANGLRQILAFCIFACSLKFIEKKKWLYYYLFVALAISMHKSSFLLILAYPFFIFKDEWFKNRVIEFILIGVSLFLLFTDLIGSKVDDIVSLVLISEDYGHYAEMLITENASSIGLGWMMNLCLYFILIYYSRDIKRFYKSKKVNYLYDLSFIGICLSIIFDKSMILNRLNYYFFYMVILFQSYALYYFNHKKKYLFYVTTIIIFLQFVACIINSVDPRYHSAFKFIWQQ